jgi:hypothetical protein
MYTDQSFAEASYPSLNRHNRKSPPICLYKNLNAATISVSLGNVNRKYLLVKEVRVNY